MRYLQSEDSKGSSADEASGSTDAGSRTGELGGRGRRSRGDGAVGGWGRDGGDRGAGGRRAGGGDLVGGGLSSRRSRGRRCLGGRRLGAAGLRGSRRFRGRGSAGARDADGNAGGGASVLNALDDLGLLVGGAGTLDAGSDRGEEGVGLLAVALEVGEFRAAVSAQCGQEALKLVSLEQVLEMLIVVTTYRALGEVSKLSRGNTGQSDEESGSEGLHLE